MLSKDDIDCVIYHSPCADGTASAAIAKHYLSSRFPDRKVQYIGIHAGSRLPAHLIADNVLICDVCFRYSDMLLLSQRVKKYLVLDHHKSSKLDLQEIPDDNKIFDMERSGAMITWNYFYGDQPAPLLIQHIQDRDLWRRQLPGNDDFVSWFFTLPFDLDVYISAFNDDFVRHGIEVVGPAYRQHNEYFRQDIIQHSDVKLTKIGDNYYFVAYVNSNILRSDIGAALLTKYPLCNFSAVYTVSDVTGFSLRSEESRDDVSVIATVLGGGGHANSSGVRINGATNALGEIVGDSKFYDIVRENIQISGASCLINIESKYHSIITQYLLQTRRTGATNASVFCNGSKVNLVAAYEFNNGKYSLTLRCPNRMYIITGDCADHQELHRIIQDRIGEL